MKLSSLLLLPFSLLLFSASSLSAQTLQVYDHFTGKTLDTQKWFADGSPMSLSNSRVHFALTAVNRQDVWSEIFSYEWFAGDFQFVLDFDNFANTIKNGASFELSIDGARKPTAGKMSVSARLHSYFDGRSNKWVRRFSSQMDVGSRQVTVNGPIIAASAGQMRIARSSAGISVSVRTSTQKGWTLIKTWTNVLPNVVHLNVDSWAGDANSNNSGKFTVDCDKVSFVSAQRFTGPVNYGKNCHDLLTVAAGVPFVGNKDFGYYLGGNGKLAGSPTAMIIGSSKMSVSLAPGAPGCYLNTNPILILPGTVLNQFGNGGVILKVQNDRRLIGVNLKVQHVVIKSGINALGIAMTQGVETKIL